MSRLKITMGTTYCGCPSETITIDTNEDDWAVDIMNAIFNGEFEHYFIDTEDVSMKAVDIKWDIDEEDFDNETEYEAALSLLPTEVEIPNDIEEDDVEDYLADKYGYCVWSFDIEYKED